MFASPELFANPFVAFVTTYTTPQILDGVITSGARNFMKVPEDTDTNTDYEEVA